MLPLQPFQPIAARKTNNEPKRSKMREQTANDCLNDALNSCTNFTKAKNQIVMGARTLKILKLPILSLKPDR